MSQLFSDVTAFELHQFVERQKLGLMVSQHLQQSLVTPLPLLVTVNSSGEIAEFFGHFARRNPQVAYLQAHPEALIVFQGPQSYIPTSWVSQAQWAPTWNYAVAHFDVEIEFLPEQTEQAIVELVEALEGESWQVSRMGDRYGQMLPHIVAFRATVKQRRVNFKLGQDENPHTFQEIVEHLAGSELATLMLRTRSHDG